MTVFPQMYCLVKIEFWTLKFTYTQIDILDEGQTLQPFHFIGWKGDDWHIHRGKSFTKKEHTA